MKIQILAFTPKNLLPRGKGANAARGRGTMRSGSLAVVRFQALAEAAGLKSPLPFSLAQLNDTHIPVQVEHGELRVSGTNPADIDIDGIIGATDVPMVINAARDIEISGFNADLNGDTYIDAIDVLLVLIAALGT